MSILILQEALNSTEKLYDVMFFEILLTYKCYLPIAQKLGIPAIGTVTLHSWMFANKAIGLFNNPAVIPLEMTHSEADMNFIERITNVWNYFLAGYYYYIKIPPLIDRYYREFFTEDQLYKKDISLIFYNNHASFLPRTMSPIAIEIGGIHVKAAKPLPKVSSLIVELFSLLNNSIEGCKTISKYWNYFSPTVYF